MGKFLTMEEIEQKFDGEWVLVEDVETDERLEILRGKVTYPAKIKTNCIAERKNRKAVILPLATSANLTRI